jgi:hypothetical protein
MAGPKDYVGKEFGDFLVESNIGHGAEAEVYQCLHRSTGLRYVLRLDVKDDSLWGAAPCLPPRNASIERANANGSWNASAFYYQTTLEKLKTDKDTWKFTVPAIYGVLGTRYLVPVASPVRVKGALGIDEVLRLAPADDLYLFAMWEDIVLQMIGGAYSDPPEAGWEQKWRSLVGGTILQKAMAVYLAGGSLSSQEKQIVLKNVEKSRMGGPELAENVLLRLCGAVSRGRVSLEQLKATLRCKHFRFNVTALEIQQMIDAYKILKSEFVHPEDSLALLGFVFGELTQLPRDPIENHEEFETRTAQPSTEQFTLFLQEHASVHQKVLTLEAA